MGYLTKLSSLIIMHQMNLFINGRNYQTESGINISDLLKELNREADIYIVNTLLVDEKYLLQDGDEVTLIKRGVLPDAQELEYMLISREGITVYSILKKACVAVCGLGGLGSTAVISLARAGIGKIKLIDFDVVEPSNLNRQHFFIEQIGMKKVDAMQEILKKVNPYISVESIDMYIDRENINGLFDDCDVVLECFDKAESKVMLIEEFNRIYKDKYLIGASGVAGFFDTGLIKKKTIGKNILIVGDFENEAGFHKGLTSTRAGTAGNIQANEAVRYLLRMTNENKS